MSSSPAQLTYFPPVLCLWGQINWGRRVRKHLLAMLLSLKLHLARTLFTLFCRAYLLRSELPHPHSQNCESLPWLFTKHMRLQSQLLKGDIFGHIHYGILLQIMFSLTCSDLSDIQFEVKSTVSNDFTLSLRLPPGHLLRISPVAPVTPSKANEGGERLVDIGTAAQPAQYIGPGCWSSRLESSVTIHFKLWPERMSRMAKTAHVAKIPAENTFPQKKHVYRIIYAYFVENQKLKTFAVFCKQIEYHYFFCCKSCWPPFLS